MLRLLAVGQNLVCTQPGAKIYLLLFPKRVDCAWQHDLWS